MVRSADELRSRAVVVNPEEDCSPAAFHALIDELLTAPESDIESLDTASVLANLRAESDDVGRPLSSLVTDDHRLVISPGFPADVSALTVDLT